MLGAADIDYTLAIDLKARGTCALASAVIAGMHWAVVIARANVFVGSVAGVDFCTLPTGNPARKLFLEMPVEDVEDEQQVGCCK